MTYRQIGCLFVLGIVFVLCLGVFSSPDRDERPKPEANRKPVAPAPEHGTVDRLEYEIRNSLGTSNRDVPRVRSFSEFDGIVTVEFSINDNLGESLIKAGARRDVREILRAASISGFPFTTILCQGTFSMQDKFGNASETLVVNATYSASAVNRINWENFLLDNVFDISESSGIHPAFR